MASLNGIDPCSGVLAKPVYVNRDGVRAIITGEATFYFSVLAGNEAGLVAAYREVKQTVAEHITWYDTEALRGPRPIKPKDLDAFEVWFAPGATQRGEYELALGSGPRIGEIGPWGFRFGVERYALPRTMGYFQFNVPAQLALANPTMFRGIACRVFEAFPWTSGHAGLGILYDPGDLDPKRDAAIRAHCMRYLGLDCSDVLTETEALGDAIKGVDWLTFLGPSLAQGLNETLATSQFPNGIIIESLDNQRLMLQAGPAPILGDRNRREDLTAYRKANEVLRPVRIEQLFPLPGFVDESDTSRWLERFD